MLFRKGHMNLISDRVRYHTVLHNGFGETYSFMGVENYLNLYENFITVYFVVVNGETVGTFTLERIPSSAIVGLCNFTILPDFRRKGIGKEVIQRLKEEVKTLALIGEPSASLRDTLYKSIPVVFR